MTCVRFWSQEAHDPGTCQPYHRDGHRSHVKAQGPGDKTQNEGAGHGNQVVNQALDGDEPARFHTRGKISGQGHVDATSQAIAYAGNNDRQHEHRQPMHKR